MAPFKKTIISFSLLALLVYFSGCANQLSPPGGEVDKIPPAIIEITPKDGTVNFHGKSFVINFSEYVDKISVQDNIFISPKIPGGLEFSWSGRSVEVVFLDSLKKMTTYSVTIGANVADLNNHNRMAEPFSFFFSTGPLIDSCRISGKVYNQDPSGVLIFAYKNKGDSLDITKEKPDYISQVGKNGTYNLSGLGYGNYNVFAIRDRLADYVYRAGEDQLGIPFSPVILTKEASNYSGLDFFITSEDTTKPHINKVVMTDKNHIAVEFSKAIDSTKLKPENFFIIDSVSSRKTGMNYFYKGQGKALQFFLAFSDSVVNSQHLYFNAKNITDISGNTLNSEAVSFVYNPRPDTAASKILKMNGQYAGDMLDFETPEIYVQFDDIFPVTAPVEGISAFDIKDKQIPVKINGIDGSSFTIGFTEKLRPKSELKVKVDLKKFKDFSSKTGDSVYTRKFSIINDIDFSGASGNISSDENQKNVHVVLDNIGREKKSYQRKTDAKGNFEIKKVVPGKYLLWSYIDADSNGVYSNGKLKPLNYSEKFKFYADTLNLRARWPVGEINLKFEKK